MLGARGRFYCGIAVEQVMKKAHQYLHSKGKSSREMRDFKHQLYDLWFKLYRRTKGSRALDSSGFEHVFVGETRGGTEVLGFHNWIQFYLQEKAGNVDYQGYILGKKVAINIAVVQALSFYVQPCNDFSQSWELTVICLLFSLSGTER